MSELNVETEKVIRYYNHIIGDLCFEEVMSLSLKISRFVYAEIYKQVSEARAP